MKKSTIKLYAISGCLLFCSCQKFLEEKPYSFQTPSSYFQNKADAYTALMGAYNGLGPDYYSRHMYFLSTLCSDESKTINGVTGEKQLDKMTYKATLSNLLALWRAMFTSIMRDNNVIAGVATVNMDDSLKQMYIGEARFLRALTYFDAVRIWGRVPLIKNVVETLEEAYVEQATLHELYDSIIEDLEFAIKVLPNKNADGRAGKGSALAILAKVYLTKATSEAAESEDYQQCIKYCDSVLSLPEFHLMDDYQKAVGGANEFNPESLFEWQGDRELNADFSSMAHFALPSGVYGIVPENATGESRFGAERTYYNKFSAKDYRKQSTFITSGKDINGNTITWLQWPFPNPSPARKLINESSNTRSGFAFGFNYLIIRLADVYLMKAEAINELEGGPTPEAYEMINTIRARARNGNGTNVSTYPADLSGLDQESFRTAVLDERMFELSYEGHRWFDLVRTHTLLEKVPAAKERHYLFPIPNTEILLSKNLLKQNEGW